MTIFALPDGGQSATVVATNLPNLQFLLNHYLNFLEWHGEFISWLTRALVLLHPSWQWHRLSQQHASHGRRWFPNYLPPRSIRTQSFTVIFNRCFWPYTASILWGMLTGRHPLAERKSITVRWSNLDELIITPAMLSTVCSKHYAYQENKHVTPLVHWPMCMTSAITFSCSSHAGIRDWQTCRAIFSLSHLVI